MPRQRLPIPFAGVANAAAFEDQRVGVVPLASLRNLVMYDRGKDRPRMGTRWGVSKFSQVRMGTGPVQALKAIESATAQVGLKANACAPVTGIISLECGPVSGHCWVLDRTISPNGHYQSTETTTEGAFACSFSTHDQDVAAFATIYNNGSYVISGIALVDIATRAILWEAECLDKDTPAGSEGTTPIYVNQILVTEKHTFVACQPGYVYAFKTSDGTFIKRYNVGGWAAEAMAIALNSAGDVLVGFYGTGATSGSMANTSETQDGHASQFVRSGVYRYTASGLDAEPLAGKAFPRKLATDAEFYEGDHGYLRLSEHLTRAPRGCIPYAMALGPDDQIVVGFTSQGWGWSTNYPPDGTTPYTTVAMFSSGGTKLWETDTDSLRRGYIVGADTFYNDIPVALSANGTPDPAVNALAVDARGDVYAAGVPNTAGYNVFKLRGTDGTILWRAKAGALVEQHAIAVDPSDGNLWVAVTRNNTWEGSEGTYAMLLKLRSSDGEIIARYDMRTASLDPFGIACNARGDVIFVSDHKA